jgi:hypothetical protein
MKPDQIQRLRSEGDGVRSNGIRVGPLYSLAGVDDDVVAHEAHNGQSRRPTACGNDLSATSGHGEFAGVCVTTCVFVLVQQQILHLVFCLFVIEALMVRKRVGERKDVNHTGHVGVDEANELVITDGGKRDGIGLAFDE